MDNRALRLGTLFLLASGLTGFRIESQTAAVSNTPLVRSVKPKTPTHMSQCNFYAFGWIPLGEVRSLEDLTQQMTAGTDGLIDVSVESSTTNFLAVSWHCWRLAGTPFSWGGALSAPVATAEGGPPASGAPDDEAAKTEAAEAVTPGAPVTAAISVVPPAPPKAEPHTQRLLKLIGTQRPESEDDYRRLCAEVWNLRMQNKLSEDQMVQLARAGSSKVAPGSDLMTVLRAGMAAGAGR
jgi:hypothetical protein